MSRHAGTLTVGVLTAAVYLAGGLGFSASATTVTRTANKVSHVRTASKGRIPRPDQSLLKPQPPPDCTFKGPLSNPMTTEETRVKLDYEQQCYRHSEMIVRASGAVATRTGDRVPMFIVPTDIGTGGDCLEADRHGVVTTLYGANGPFSGDCDAILSALQDDDQNYGSAYRP